jgi:hypothetical protein
MSKPNSPGLGATFEEYPDFTEKGDPACVKADVDIFFKDVNEAGYKHYSEEAKKFCKTCPYVAECLEWALKNNEMGVWGGTTERERRMLKRRNLLN